jgi:AcrR family transcriptional regulator
VGVAVPSEVRREKNAERKLRTRQRLLDAAASVFALDGYHRPRISDIVATAQVGQGTFYRHFDSKRAVFEALFDRLFGQLLAEFTPLSDNLPQDHEGYRSASRAVVARLSGVVEANRGLVGLFLRDGRSVDDDFEQKLSATFDRFADLARFYLDHAIQQGFARRCRSDLVAQALVGMALRMVDRWLSSGFDNGIDEDEIDEVITELVDLAFLGFGKPKGEDHG